MDVMVTRSLCIRAGQFRVLRGPVCLPINAWVRFNFGDLPNVDSCLNGVARAVLLSERGISSSHNPHLEIEIGLTYLNRDSPCDADPHIPLRRSFSLAVSAEISFATASRDLRAKPSKAGLPGSHAESKLVMALPCAAKSQTVCVRSKRKVVGIEAVFSGVI